MNGLIDSHAVTHVVSDVTLAFLGEVASPMPRPRHADVAWCGSVHLSGSFEGAVVVCVTSELAARFAHAIFSEEAPSLQREAVAEVVNVFGGNAKALFADAEHPVHLHSPKVEPATCTTVLGKVAFDGWFQCPSGILRLRVVAAKTTVEAS